MKPALLTFFISLLIIPACRKNNSGDSDILGSWKLIEVYDKSNATTGYPPAGSGKDVIITFENGNRFTGNTLVNSITNGTFTLNGNKITIGSFSMTKIMEDQWGGIFLTVLTACPLQSITPCIPSDISVHGKIMKIASALRYDITLEKL